VIPSTLSAPAHDLLAGIDRLTLSEDRGIATLIRSCFWRALGSSPAALLGTLTRYDRLLHHAKLAGDSGRTVSRAAIRDLAGRDPEQLVLWELFSQPDAPVELALSDRPSLASLLQAARSLLGAADAKCQRLETLLQDGEPSLVFTTSRDTLSWLRGRLAERRPAWLNGEAAGIGSIRMPRDDVLTWFRPGPGAPQGSNPHCPADRRPALLLATDVAAEGLDLQRVGRVVHYDLPWTSVRLEQRDGRALRLGSTRNEVAVAEFHLPDALEQRLDQLTRLAVKRRLPSHVGLSADHGWVYRWRVDLAEWAGSGTARSGIAVVEGDEAGWLIGLALDMVGRDGRPWILPANLFWIGDDGSIVSDPEILTRRLRDVADRAWRAPSEPERQRLQGALVPPVRSRLRAALGEGWQGSRQSGEQRSIARRLRRLAAGAARRRDARLLARLDQALDWLAGRVSAGEAAILRRAADLEAEALLAAVERLSRTERRQEIPVPRLTGVVRVARFPECQPFERSCSISTGR
jgi:hypothetical protein